jgi:PAP2 superfamily protein
MLRAIRRTHAGWQETAALTLLYAVYEIVRGFRHEDVRAAVGHAAQVVRLEETLGLCSERAVQRFAETVPLLTHVLAVLYPGLHVAATVGVLVWLHRKRRQAFPLVRTALVLMTALALVVYLLYPVAPPRLALSGVIDTVTEDGPVNLSSELLGRFYNPVAAVPSLHLGYAALAGGAIAWQARRLRVRVAGALYPLLALFVIVATGNHFYFDAAAGAAVAAAATAAASVLMHERQAADAASQSQWVRRRGGGPAHAR